MSNPDDDFLSDKTNNEGLGVEPIEPHSNFSDRSFSLEEKRAEAGRSASQLWLVSYSDFMTILTIFFLAMYGYSYMDATTLFASQKESNSSVAFVEMLEKLKGELGEQIQVQNDVDKVTIQMTDDILFASGRADLSTASGNTMKNLADSLSKVEGDIVVQGHTDNMPVRRGNFKSNWELSAARAFSVIEGLTTEGIPANRLSAWGFGEHRPRASNDSDLTRAQNRRIEITVFKKSKTKV